MKAFNGLLAILFSVVSITAAASAPAGTPEELVEVDVQVVEVNKTKMTKVGLDWVRLLEGTPDIPSPVSPAEFLESGGAVSRLGTFSRGQVDAFVHALETNNYGKLLAKPKLLTVSGLPANFLVGGEIPVVSQDTQGHTTVNWKEYGVKLSIKPEKKEKSIRTSVRAEASTIDAATAVNLPNGTYMPGLRTRWAETTVELPSKSTVIIAGLIQTEDVKVSSGLPVLSDLPLLGWLFRSTRLERNETELVIFVTPSLVTPAGGSAP
jgi:pilus assembly protein CpaC